MTAADLLARLTAAQPGQTVALSGELPGLTVKAPLPANLTLDLAGATVTGPWRFADQQGLAIRGGVWTAPNPLTATRSAWSLSGATLRGDGTGHGITATGGELTVTDCAFEDFSMGVVMADLSRFRIARAGFSGMTSDGIQGASVRNGQIVDVSVHGSGPSDNAHPDAVQLRSLPGKPPTAHVLIQGLRAIGPIQGVALTDHGTGGFDDIALRDVDITAGDGSAVLLVRVRGLRLEDVHVRTYPGAQFQARIALTECSDVIWAGPASAAAYGGKKALTYAGPA